MKNSPFPPHGNNRPVIPLVVRLLLHVRRERDGAHNTVPELLVHHRLVRIPVVLHDLVQAVDQRLARRHVHRAAPVRVAGQRGGQAVLGDCEKGGEGLDVVGRGARLAVEDGGRGDLAAANVLGDLLEGDGLGGFGREEEV